MGNAESLPTTAQQQASSLMALPAELRVEIYELVFGRPAGPVDLLHAAAPSNALLLACRQTHNEARALYQDAYRRYWPETDFTIRKTATGEASYRRSTDAQQVVEIDFTQQDLARIRHLRFVLPAHELVQNAESEILRETTEQIYSPRAVLGLRRSDDQREWYCVDVDGAEIDRTQSRVYIRITGDTSCRLAFDDSAQAAHWDASKAFCPVTVEEIQVLAGVLFRLKPTSVRPLYFGTDAGTPTILPLAWPSDFDHPVSRNWRDAPLGARPYWV